jgi:hypothetical protein
MLQNFHRGPSPPAFDPPDQFQKLARRLGVSLRGGCEHRSDQGLHRRYLRDLVAFSNRDRSSGFVQGHGAQAIANSAAQPETRLATRDGARSEAYLVGASKR